MTEIPDLPRLAEYDAILFDLDGVITPTADIHMHAWRVMFTDVFAQRGVAGYTDSDYFTFLDGKARYEGVAGLLESRGISLPSGSPDDSSDAETVCGIGNRKNAVFSRVLSEDGIAPYPGSLALLDQLRVSGMVIAIVSSSKNAEWVLTAANIRDRFPVVVDGVVAAAVGLGSKPAPDMFLHAARLLGVEPARAVVVEDAISGVAAGHAGGFGLVIGVDRGTGAGALIDVGADLVVSDLRVFVV